MKSRASSGATVSEHGKSEEVSEGRTWVVRIADVTTEITSISVIRICSER